MDNPEKYLGKRGGYCLKVCLRECFGDCSGERQGGVRVSVGGIARWIVRKNVWRKLGGSSEDCSGECSERDLGTMPENNVRGDERGILFGKRVENLTETIVGGNDRRA